jgi:hypothetical protein
MRKNFHLLKFSSSHDYSRDEAAQNAHTSTNMVMKVYAINEKERQHQRLKLLENKFA